MGGKQQRQNSNSSLIGSITHSFLLLFEIVQADIIIEIIVQGTVEPFT